MVDVWAIVLFGTGISFIILFLYSIVARKNRVSRIFSLICLAIAIYVIGYGFEPRADSVEEIDFFLKLEYFGSPFMFPLWFMLVYSFYFNRNLPFKYVILLFIVPVLTVFLRVTNEYHHLFYRELSAIQYDGFILANLKVGPWYYFYIIYSYVLFFIGLIYVFKAWRISPYKRRAQSFLLFMGTLVPGIIEFFYFAGLSPYGLDLTPFAASALALCYFIALFRYGFLELDEIIQNVIFTEISEGIIVLDSQKRLLDFNKAARKVFSWLETKIIGENLNHVIEAKELIEQEGNVFEINVPRGGASRIYEFHLTELKEATTIMGFVYLVRDITEQKKLIHELDNLASFDSLTHIYNRRRFMKEVEIEALRAQRYSGCLSILMIDIDLFKKVNDQYGHLVGDEVLKSIATVCKSRVRRTDSVGRYGGEEFAILLPETNMENANRVAEEIRRHIEDMETTFMGRRIKVTVSIGVSSATGNLNEEIDIYQLINKADMALYHAKNNGRNRVSNEMETKTFSWV